MRGEGGLTRLLEDELCDGGDRVLGDSQAEITLLVLGNLPRADSISNRAHSVSLLAVMGAHLRDGVPDGRLEFLLVERVRGGQLGARSAFGKVRRGERAHGRGTDSLLEGGVLAVCFGHAVLEWSGAKVLGEVIGR